MLTYMYIYNKVINRYGCLFFDVVNTFAELWGSWVVIVVSDQVVDAVDDAVAVPWLSGVAQWAITVNLRH